LETLKFYSKLDLPGLGNIIKINHSINNDENLKADRQKYYKVWQNDMILIKTKNRKADQSLVFK